MESSKQYTLSQALNNKLKKEGKNWHYQQSKDEIQKSQAQSTKGSVCDRQGGIQQEQLLIHPHDAQSETHSAPRPLSTRFSKDTDCEQAKQFTSKYAFPNPHPSPYLFKQFNK